MLSLKTLSCLSLKTFAVLVLVFWDLLSDFRRHIAHHVHQKNLIVSCGMSEQRRPHEIHVRCRSFVLNAMPHRNLLCLVSKSSSWGSLSWSWFSILKHAVLVLVLLYIITWVTGKQTGYNRAYLRTPQYAVSNSTLKSRPIKIGIGINISLHPCNPTSRYWNYQLGGMLQQATVHANANLPVVLPNKPWRYLPPQDHKMQWANGSYRGPF